MPDQLHKNSDERRGFPRLETQCPVLYAIGNSKKWRVAILVNYSATGLLLKCKEQLMRNINITIMIKPGSNRLAPKITAIGTVTRCEPLDGTEFHISLKLSKVKPA